jgi:hypothetical protein
MNTSLDPWAMQRDLMAASNQTLPAAPELNRGGLLYGALILEEASETLSAVSQATAASELSAILAAQGPRVAALSVVAAEFQDIASKMHEASLRIRGLLETLPVSLRIELSRKLAIEIADGTTDIAVVNSGFALSSGIDGPGCYQDVAGSNLSKKNPDTGKIDKTADGKWIKGRNYRAPNLEAVLYPDPTRPSTPQP